MIAATLGLFPFFYLALAILAFVFWIWMLVDCVQNPRLTSTQKIVWALIILFLNDLGALIYFFAAREH